jgi:iron complex outermembrane receptor protein
MKVPALVDRYSLPHFLCAGLLACLVFSNCPAFAGQTDADEPAEEPLALERIQVTGSRIKRIDAEGDLPVTIIDRETIERSGKSELGDYVRSLSFNTHGSYRSQMDGTDVGTAQISLRGLGSGRSLVLIDGKRLPKAPLSSIYQDLNIIPIGWVERVEVLPDGASAIYGSDAIAGVINIITRSDYDGLELMYGRAWTDPKGGDRDYGAVTFGHAGEQWRLLGTWSWNDRDITYNRDFDWYRPASDITANNFTTFDPATGLPLQNFTAIPDGCGGSEAFSLVPFPASLNGELCLYDSNLESANETSGLTEGLFVKFDYRFGAGWTAWSSARWSHSKADGELAPPDWSSEWFGFFGFQWPLPEGSPNNPTNPASAMHDAIYGPNTPVNYYHRFDSLGNFRSTYESELRDLLLGLSGLLGTVELDVGYRFTRSETEDLTIGIDPFTAHALIIDGAYDLQHPDRTPADVLDTITMDQLSRWEFTQDELFASAAWNLFEIGGAPLQWVVGAEFHEESWASEIIFQEALGSDRDIFSMYFETLLTLNPDLEITVAGRYDDYSDWGDHFSPGLSLRWRIADPLVLRASWGEGFRAPELAVQGTPTYETYEWIHDPLSCEALGWAPDCAVPYLMVNTVSPEIGPEQSNQYLAGLAWQPRKFLFAALDYYNIRLRDEIKFFWPELLLGMDYAADTMPPGLGVERHPQTGQLVSITAGWGNHGKVKTSGLDLTVNLDFELGPGRWHSNLLASRVLEDNWNGFDTLGLPGVPKYRATLSSYYELPDFTFSWNVHTIAGQDRQDENWSGESVPAWTTQDFQVAWRTPWRGALAVGVENAFNEQPAIGQDNRYNTWLYDPFGRILYARYSQTF